MEDLQPKDPLRNVPDAQRELFTRLSNACEGFTAQDVVGAAGNLILNAMRQQFSTRDKAEISFNEIFGKVKQLLMNHYDVTGRKRGIFPYDQVIDVPHFNFKDKAKFNGK
jgi:hypothetical protein